VVVELESSNVGGIEPEMRLLCLVDYYWLMCIEGVDVVRGVVLGDVDRVVAVGVSVDERRVDAMRKQRGISCGGGEVYEAASSSGE
jgi:hypothetical protein